MDINDLSGRNIVVYDLEIKKPVEKCKNGWKSKDEMGISVGCAFDYREMRYRVFLDDNMQELCDRLNEANTLVVAFNHVSFDNELLRASGFALNPDRDLMNYDMLQISKRGASAGQFDKGYSLDNHLEALGLPMKTANGAMAPIWYEENRLGTLVDYCLNDVAQEKRLFEYFCQYGQSKSLGRPDFYRIERYTDLFGVV